MQTFFILLIVAIVAFLAGAGVMMLVYRNNNKKFNDVLSIIDKAKLEPETLVKLRDALK